ncbi:hypothetical protein OHB12_00610 [Nocardia sp. NBC_01730]|uniref:hypothetical protein n=1 Tax=Nocardia sp. NBC_01730 TaxID=2975998 RepID=UPI002E1673B1|nr:hypothetical protein OHB12_00610 [Nocardia sp. NBC_01730]
MAVHQRIWIGIRTSYYIGVMAGWVDGVNRLRVLLGSIFSGSEAAFDYSARAPLIVVTARCTTAEIQAAGIDGVTTHRTENGAWTAAIGKTATAAVATTEAHTLALPGETDTAMLVKFLATLSRLETEGPPRQFSECTSSRTIHTQAFLALADRLVDALGALLGDGREDTRETSTPAVTATWHRHWESFLARAQQGDGADPRCGDRLAHIIKNSEATLGVVQRQSDFGDAQQHPGVSPDCNIFTPLE